MAGYVGALQLFSLRLRHLGICIAPVSTLGYLQVGGIWEIWVFLQRPLQKTPEPPNPSPFGRPSLLGVSGLHFNWGWGVVTCNWLRAIG